MQPRAKTIEEQILLKSFAAFNWAETFDKMCNEGKITQFQNTKNQNTVMWLGNQQVLAYMLSAPMHKRFPKDSVKKSTKRLSSLAKNYKNIAEKTITKEGCNSEKSKDLRDTLKFYTSIRPQKLYAFLSEKITKNGGTITRSTDR